MGSLKRAPIRICPGLRTFSLIGFHRKDHRNDHVDREIARRDGREGNVFASRPDNLEMIIAHEPAHFLIFEVNLAHHY
jgi:hypothetical protein